MKKHFHGKKFNIKMRQTMKKYSIFMAAVALMFAACNKMEEVNTVEPVVETELITVEINPMTKTSLGTEGTTVWDAGDVVSLTVDGKKIGDLKLVEGSTFSGEVEAGHIGAALLHYPSGVSEVPTAQLASKDTFADGAALLDGETTMEDLRAGTTVELKNSTALLKFETSISGNVAFTIGTKTYTVTGCESGNTYYACVDPETTGKLSYTVGIVLGANEKDNFVPVANKVYPLGTLPLKENDIYAVVGDYSNDDWGTDTKMYKTTKDNLFVAYGIKFGSKGNFKIRKAGTWVDDYNFGSANTTTKAINSAVGVFTHGSSADITVDAGTYDIYFDRLAGQVYIMEPGKPYTEATKQPAPANTYYSLIGTIAGSNWDKDFDMLYSGDGIWTIVQNFTKGAEWKIRKNHDWAVSYNNVWVGWSLKTDSNGNLKMNAAGDYVVTYIQKNKNSETDIITLANK